MLKILILIKKNIKNMFLNFYFKNIIKNMDKKH